MINGRWANLGEAMDKLDHVAPLTENREVQDYRKHHRHVYDLLASTSAKTLQSQISK